MLTTCGPPPHSYDHDHRFNDFCLKPPLSDKVNSNQTTEAADKSSVPTDHATDAESSGKPQKSAPEQPHKQTNTEGDANETTSSTNNFKVPLANMSQINKLIDEKNSKSGPAH